MYKITNNKDNEITLDEAIRKYLIIGVLNRCGNKTITIRCHSNQIRDLFTFAPFNHPIGEINSFYMYKTKLELLENYNMFTPVTAFETYQEAYAWMLEDN